MTWVATACALSMYGLHGAGMCCSDVQGSRVPTIRVLQAAGCCTCYRWWMLATFAWSSADGERHAHCHNELPGLGRFYSAPYANAQFMPMHAHVLP